MPDQPAPTRTALADTPDGAAPHGDDAALARAAQAGDVEALHVLVDRMRAMIGGMARDRFIPGGEHDDLVQEGMVGLWHAIRDYDPDAGPFGPFARLCIDRQMWSAVTAANRQRHRVLRDAASFEEWMDVPDDRHDPERLSIDAESVRTLGAEIVASLSSLETEVLRRYAEGSSYDDIADALAVHRKRVDNALQRARRKVAGLARLAEPTPA